MSNTMRRNGSKVEQAAYRLAGMNDFGHFTVGEVAKEAGVSKPTARKYLKMLVESDMLDCWVFIGSSTKVFRVLPVQLEEGF